MTELLAPAGNMEALKAALANGADAVYVGGKQFSARAYADNFSDEELEQAIALAHFYGKKIYLALNTLLADSELPQALAYAGHYYHLGVDALIVQDLGFLRLARELMPDLPLHASTQTTVTNAASARFLAGQGVKRVILARELSLAEIKSIKEKADIELEAFVHGALCFCYSGQCLMSSMIGGRSGNRGRCAQPCRLPYTLTDAYGDPLPVQETGEYLLSTRDLVGYWHLEELHELGLAALKIEGRMKKPEYVATVCRIYSQHLQLLNSRRVIYQNEEEQRQLLQMFNRDFCYSYWLGNPGASLMSYKRPNNRGVFLGRVQSRAEKSIVVKLEQPLGLGDGLEIWVKTGGRYGFTVESMYQGGEALEQAQAGQVITLPAASGKPGDRIFKTYDKQLHDQARLSYAALPDIPLSFTLHARENAPLAISARDRDGFSARVLTDYMVETAINSVSDWQTVQAQLSRLGGSGFCLDSLDGELDEGVMLPASVLNNCRRELVQKLVEQRLEQFRRPEISLFPLGALSPTALPAAGPLTLSALLDRAELAPQLARAGIRELYFGTEGLAPAPGPDQVDWPRLHETVTKAGGRLIPSLPHIIKAGEEDAWLRRIAAWQELGLPALRLNHFGQIELARQAGWQGELLGGPGLSVFNSATYRFFSDESFTRLTLSPELNLPQLQELAAAGAQKEIVAQGALPLMVSEHCLLGSLQGGCDLDKPCSAPCKTRPAYALRDEKGYLFPCKSDAFCRSHIFNSRQLCLLTEIPALVEAGINCLNLDLRLYEAPLALRLAGLYKLALGDQWEFAEAVEKLPQVVSEYTKGHLHRGV